MSSTVHPPIRRKIPTSTVCEMLGVTRETLLALRQRNPNFPRPYRYAASSRLVYEEQELLEWMESQRVEGPTHAA